MADESQQDHYETLQISANAEPETVHRVYRLLAQRFHPDNQDSGNERRFRELTEAYQILSDPERRAQYDIQHAQRQRQRWKLVSTGEQVDNDFEAERQLRLTVLEVLYTRRRMDADSPGVMPIELESLTGRPREHLEFTIWFLFQRKYLTRTDSSMLTITADGVEYLEKHYQRVPQHRRLN
jgi:curved DNA-binding protein CbpA